MNEDYDQLVDPTPCTMMCSRRAFGCRVMAIYAEEQADRTGSLSCDSAHGQ